MSLLALAVPACAVFGDYDFGDRSLPAINATFFPSTDIRGYWTSSKAAIDPNVYAWRVDFYDGVTNGGAAISTWTDPVRCVR